ncbi:odorant receptor 4-like isoform X2 [Cryptotermes secundus]|uniref:odorant receptor 4-like isoform X2 n=1 Tax=Cryptotermes secundus TaxID=105785 RepID=UPI000CD7B0A3|nr:odorant receptor 4-like isoform X2 [Cryptotermes secundus]
MADNTAINGKDKGDDRFRIIQWLFMWVACPLVPVKGSRLYDMYCVLLVACSYLTQVFVVMGILKNLHDVSYIMEAVRPLLSMCSVIWMHFFISFKKQGVRELLSILKNFTWSDVADTNTKAGWISRIQIIAYRANITLIVSHVSYWILRILTNNSTLFFNTWIPFGQKSNLSYVFILIIQLVTNWFCSLAFCGTLSLYSVMVIACCIQLEKIQTALLDMKQREEEPESVMKDRLAQCVRHHQKVLRFMSVLEDTFYLVILGPFIFVAVGLCFAAFTVMTMGKYSEVYQALLIILVLLAELQIFCWFGNELTEQSGLVREAAWKSDWAGSPVSHQRSINVLMTVSEEFTLTAGKIFPVSRRTMLKVLNETYSYFLFLLSFVKKSSEDM